MVTQMTPRISIAMATYNGASYIKEQLDSIFNQSFQDFEVVICDDKSSDDTIKIIKEYQKIDSRIILRENEINLGFKKNFEQAISLCSGEYIAFCDQDDIWTYNHLEILIDNIGNCDCIGANADFISSEGTPLNISMTKYLLIHSIPQNSGELFKHELYGNMIQGTASMFSKRLLKHAFPMPCDIKFHDYWIALNAGLHAGCTYVNQSVLKYRRHANNATEYEKFSFFKTIKKLKQLSENKESYYKEWIPYLENLLKKNPDDDKRNKIETVLNFYRNLAIGKKRFSCLFYYITHYREITLTYYRHLPAFGFRVLSLLIFGIKY